MKKTMTGILCGTLAVGFGAAMGGSLQRKYLLKTLKEKSEQADKYCELFQLVNQWVNVKQKGKSLAEYFEKRGYQNIAIYGMNFAGETLINELEESSICVKYGIDRDAKHIMANCNVVTPDDIWEKVDAIVVTPVYYFSEIADAMKKKVSCPVVSLEDIIYETL